MRNPKRRPSLAALAKSRGYPGPCGVLRRTFGSWYAYAGRYVGEPSANAPTRRSAEAGLRAALEALPAVHKEKR